MVPAAPSTASLTPPATWQSVAATPSTAPPILLGPIEGGRPQSHHTAESCYLASWDLRPSFRLDVAASAPPPYTHTHTFQPAAHPGSPWTLLVSGRQLPHCPRHWPPLPTTSPPSAFPALPQPDCTHPRPLLSTTLRPPHVAPLSSGSSQAGLHKSHVHLAPMKLQDAVGGPAGGSW